MSNKDNRLDALHVAEEQAHYGVPVRIEKIYLSHYKFFYDEITLPFDGGNVLIYGENGSGKSSIFNALELLAGKGIDNFFENNHNIFDKTKYTGAEFTFSNGKELTITSDTAEIPDYLTFLHGLSIFVPMLNYKKLLKIHYPEHTAKGQMNLYNMFQELLKNYPVDKKTHLGEIDDLNQYFEELKKILRNDLLKDINRFLNDYFKADFKIDSLDCNIKRSDDGSAEPTVNLLIDFKDNQITEYHTFLNEARLSALAISIYLVTILKLHGTIKKETLKVLVLDDLLISLDMSNRLKLLEILKNEFKNFQVFFFTHDKELFELYRNKLDWAKKYELYLHENQEGIPDCIVKEGRSEIERAKEFYAGKDYDCCALLLRKGFGKILRSFLSPQEQRDRNCEDLDLSKLVGKAISKSSGEEKTILEKLDSDRKHILNPLSHNDNRPIYSEELKSAMSDLETLKEKLR